MPTPHDPSKPLPESLHPQPAPTQFEAKIISKLDELEGTANIVYRFDILSALILKQDHLAPVEKHKLLSLAFRYLIQAAMLDLVMMACPKPKTDNAEIVVKRLLTAGVVLLENCEANNKKLQSELESKMKGK